MSQLLSLRRFFSFHFLRLADDAFWLISSLKMPIFSDEELFTFSAFGRAIAVFFTLSLHGIFIDFRCFQAIFADFRFTFLRAFIYFFALSSCRRLTDTPLIRCFDDTEPAPAFISADAQSASR